MLVGINLLREGLDLPEVSLVAILDADKEGFLRSETSLIQTMGRAARNVDGQVIMYADTGHRLDAAGDLRDATAAAAAAAGLQRGARHRPADDPQGGHRHPRRLLRPAETAPVPGRDQRSRHARPVRAPTSPSSRTTSSSRLIRTLEEEMHEASADLRFEYAARLRDEIKDLKRELREVV